MPSIRKQLIIAVDADKSGVEAAVQADKPTFALTVPLYTEADPTPRPVTHWWTSFTSAPLPSIEDPVTGAKVTFPNSFFEEYFAPAQSTYPQTRLVDLGLTTNET